MLKWIYITITCLSSKNIILDTDKKYYFSYNKKNSGNDITFYGEDVFEDKNKVSLIFSPEIPEGQILYKDNRGFMWKMRLMWYLEDIYTLQKNLKRFFKKQKMDLIKIFN